MPWKYGFKSIKSIVKINFRETQPNTTWNDLQANEYGFYANVNPEVHHPRWRQTWSADYLRHYLVDVLSKHKCLTVMANM